MATAGVRQDVGRRVLLLLSLMVFACGKDSPTGPGQTIGPDGGILEFAGGSVALLFPAGAVSRNVRIDVEPTMQYPASAGVVSGTVYEFQPAGLRFAVPVGLGIAYNPAAVPPGVAELELTLGRVTGNAWEEVTGTEVSPPDHAVVGAINGFSVYGVMAIPVGSVAVSPTSASMVREQTLHLKAAVLSPRGDTLRLRRVSWSSSNPLAASVDTGGVVTGVGDGAATITARSDGVEGAASISAVVLHFGSVTAAGQHSCGLTISGAAYCWGDIPTSLTGPENAAIPRPVSGSVTFRSLDGGQNHTCGVDVNNVGYCWGRGEDGQLGNGSSLSDWVLAPARVAGVHSWAAVSAGFEHTCGLTTGGDAYCWGNNFFGQLGDGSTTFSSVPILVVGGFKFQSVTAGAWFSCGVAIDGRGLCWGYNVAGKLGDSTTQDHNVPTLIAGGLTFRTISAGGNYACGVTTDDRAYCWGANNYGDLGDSSTTDRTFPGPVAGSLTFLSISADNAHSCGVAAGGAAYCWGANGSGALGIGSTISQTAPVQVTGGLMFESVSTSLSGVGAHTCGLTTSNLVYCWGSGDRAQLGNGATANVTFPVRVLGQQ